MNERRLLETMRAAVRRFSLDLAGMRVLTEAGTGYFAATPVIAALAGAEVDAASKTTPYGTFDEVAALVGRLAGLAGVAGRVRVVAREAIAPGTAYDIVTNLNHLRPLDAGFLGRLDTARTVIPYMAEAWEVRAGDVDLEFCRARGIPVAGTNEGHPDVDCFATCGAVVAKLLLERDFQLRGGHYAVVGGDHFADVVADYLRRCGAEVDALAALEPARLAGVEAVVLADYTTPHPMLGPGGADPAAVAAANPAVEVIALAGGIDFEACRAAGLPVHPPASLPPLRMSRTLAYVGPRPVVDLHAAGLKVGELLRRKQVTPLVQPMTFEALS